MTAPNRDAAYVTREEYERVVAGRDEAVRLLMADPEREAVAVVEGLRKLLPELKIEEDESIHAICDWIGVARRGSPECKACCAPGAYIEHICDEFSASERVRLLALELATRQGLGLADAERLCPVAA